MFKPPFTSFCKKLQLFDQTDASSSVRPVLKMTKKNSGLIHVTKVWFPEQFISLFLGKRSYSKIIFVISFGLINNIVYTFTFYTVIWWVNLLRHILRHPVSSVPHPDDTPVASAKAGPSNGLGEADDEGTGNNGRLWRTVLIGEQEHRIDMQIIRPYLRVITHGGQQRGQKPDTLIKCTSIKGILCALKPKHATFITMVIAIKMNDKGIEVH